MSLDPEKAERLRDQIFNETRQALEDSGLSLSYLIKKLKKELNAKTTKTQKIKGSPGKDIPSGYRCIVTTGLIEYVKVDGDLEKEYAEGDSLIQWDEEAMDIRQRARMDAHKLRGDYPSEKHEVNITGDLPGRIRDARERAKKRS